MIITDKYLKQYSPLPLNFNLDEVRNYVSVAEKLWVIGVIGEDLYDEINEQVANNTVSEQNATLLTEGGLWQYLAFATVYEALPMLWSRITEVGVVKGHSDNSDSLELKDMTYVSNHLRGQVEVLKDMLKKWLCQHQDSFPLMDVCGCSCDSCCEKHAKLNNPNQYRQLYKPYRKCTDLI